MKTVHILKLKDCYLKEVMSKKKSFELRYDDRNYCVNDLIHFIKTDCKEFTNYKYNLFKITYKLDSFEDGLHSQYCILVIKKLNKLKSIFLLILSKKENRRIN